jgi:hypothetical protein
MATAATTVISGSAGASANANGGNGGNQGTGNDGNGGFGGPATALATGSSGSGGASASASASATGGNGGVGDAGRGGGDASATSTAIANGSGDALSSANATGGGGVVFFSDPGNATARADASAAGGGKAIATTVATGGAGFSRGTANATSTAKTSFAGVSVQSTAMDTFVGSTTTEAIAQGGSGQTFIDPGATAAIAIATALPDKAYATTLIGGASNVADALLGPSDVIFGTASLQSLQPDGTVSTTFDFHDQGDLLVGVIEGSDFDIIVNGAQVFTGGSVTDAVINLGFNFGPDIDLTINGFGAFVVGGLVPEAVPEASTWAMMLAGFAGLGFVGYRRLGLKAEPIASLDPSASPCNI